MNTRVLLESLHKTGGDLLNGVETWTFARLAGAFEAMLEEVSSSEVDCHKFGAQKGVYETRCKFLVERKKDDK